MTSHRGIVYLLDDKSGIIKAHRGRVIQKMEMESVADLVRTADILRIGRKGS